MDNAATTRIKLDVLKEMMPYLTDRYGNPSSVHEEGRRARQAIDRARETVLKAFGLKGKDPSCVIFTSGATESNNLAINTFGWDFIASPLTEHSSVIKSAESMGFHYWLKVDRAGKIELDANKKAIMCAKLIEMALANNETGTIQDTTALMDFLEKNNGAGKMIMLDATQAIGHCPQATEFFSGRFNGSRLLTFSAHKFGGPKGIGAIVSDRPLRELKPLVLGGQQEFGVRAGTENVAAIVGLGKAVELAMTDMEHKAEYTRWLAKKLATGILSDIESTWLNGPEIGSERLPGNVNISFAGCRGDAIVLSLDEAGVAVSSGSACHSGEHTPSHVLMEMYHDEPRALSSVRFSLNEENTEEEVDYVLSVLPKIVGDLRQ